MLFFQGGVYLAEVFHSPPHLRHRHCHRDGHHRRAGGREPAGRTVPAHFAADGQRRDELCRRERQRGERDGGAGHRAAGQRRRRHGLYVVELRRHGALQPVCGLRSRFRRRHGHGEDAEWRFHREPQPACRGHVLRRDDEKSVAGYGAGRVTLLAERHLYAAVHEKLRRYLHHRQNQARARRRRREHFRAGLCHAHLAEPGQAGGAGPHRYRRDRRNQEPKRAGPGGYHRYAADTEGAGKAIHGPRGGPSRHRRGICQYHRSLGSQRLLRPHEGHRAHRDGRAS